MAVISVFVACPYNLFPLNDYKAAFNDSKKEIENVKFTFADEKLTNKNILDKITGYIRSHEICLFDITGWNVNVGLELGIAIGMQKGYFILFNPRLDHNKDAPSDLKGVERIQYESNQELTAKIILLMKQELPALLTQEPRSTRKTGVDNSYDKIRRDIERALERSPSGLAMSEIASKLKQDITTVRPVVYSLVKTYQIKYKGANKGRKYYHKTMDMRFKAPLAAK